MLCSDLKVLNSMTQQTSVGLLDDKCPGGGMGMTGLIHSGAESHIRNMAMMKAHSLSSFLIIYGRSFWRDTIMYPFICNSPVHCLHVLAHILFHVMQKSQLCIGVDIAEMTSKTNSHEDA